MTTIFFPEDDETIRRTVCGYLEAQGFRMVPFAALEDARRALETRVPDLVLLDWNLPDGSGEEFCRKLRRRWPRLPILFLTVRSDARDLVTGLDAGADDYVTKPFDLDVLCARVRALLRRASPGADASPLSCGPLRLDPEACTVLLDGEIIPISPLERDLLRVLLENRGKTVSRQRLLRIWDDQGLFVNDNTLTVAIRRLRKTLRQPAFLKTVRSAGYRMEEPL